jgi:hypothetical protein
VRLLDGETTPNTPRKVPPPFQALQHAAYAELEIGQVLADLARGRVVPRKDCTSQILRLGDGFPKNQKSVRCCKFFSSDCVAKYQLFTKT